MALKSDSDIVLFQYKDGTSIFHRLPSWIKILLLVVVGYAVFMAPVTVCATLIPIVVIIAFFCNFRIEEQLADIKPAAYYAVLLYVITLGTNIAVDISSTEKIAVNTSFFLPQHSDIRLVLRLVLTLQISSLLFRTTTPFALRSGISEIEGCIRKIFHLSEQNNFSQFFSIFLLFIPRVFSVWHAAEKTWKARGGKSTIRKITILFPLLISVCIHKAWQTERALENRGSC